jgi:Kdo2-lipid IVA lauroyltransferase/acyltransferase
MTEPGLTVPQKLRYGVEAAGFFVLMALFRVIGLEAASALGGFMGRNIFSLLPPDRTARKNLLAAFPEKTDAERDAIRIAMWDNLGRVVAEYPHLEKFSPLGDDPRITFAAPESPETYKGQAILFLSGHFANWEMMPILGEQHGLKGATVVRPPNNPYIANWIARQRALNGPDSLLAKQSAARRMMGHLRGGGVIYMLIDQKLREGIAVPFFGRDAMTTPAPAALALKLGARILMAANRRTKGARFHVTVSAGPEFTPSGDETRDIHALTAALTARIEESVRADPGQWLWIHNRWPTARDIALTRG